MIEPDLYDYIFLVVSRLGDSRDDFCSYNYKRAFDWIEESNVASIKTSEACGMRPEGSRLDVVGITRKLVEAKDGEEIVYVYDNPN